MNHRAQLQTYLQQLHGLEPGWRCADTMLTEFTDVFGPLDKFEKEWKQYASASVMVASQQTN
jgi:hypothetical protein